MDSEKVLVVKHHRTVGTLVECDGKFLILHRTDNRWGLPAGKIEKGESDLAAAKRELKEETGISADELEHVMDFEWSAPGLQVTFPAFRLRLKHLPAIVLDRKEHRDFRWVTPVECSKMSHLIIGFRDLLEKVYGVPAKPI